MSAEMKPGDTVFVTKWALTAGIQRAVVIESDSAYPYLEIGVNHVCIRRADVHITIEDAQACVREMVAAKRRSIEKQLAKLAKIERDGAKVVP